MTGWVAVENWDMFEKVMDYVYSRSIKSESCLHPLLMSEPAVSKHTHTPHTHTHTHTHTHMHVHTHTHKGKFKGLFDVVAVLLTMDEASQRCHTLTDMDKNVKSQTECKMRQSGQAGNHHCGTG